jgi:hypothetical protein
MSLFIPDSYYYGEKEFPWGGLIEPKLYQRISWLLVVSGVIGKIPVISMCPSNTVPVSICFDGTVSSSMCLPGVEVFVGPFGVSEFCVFKNENSVCISKVGVNSCVQTLSCDVGVSKNLLEFAIANTTTGVVASTPVKSFFVSISNKVSMK